MKKSGASQGQSASELISKRIDSRAPCKLQKRSDWKVFRAMPLSFSQQVVASPDVMIRSVGEESVLLNLRTELYLGLDPVGTRMWEALVESPSIQQAYELILAVFDVGDEELRRDLEEFIGKLLEYQLVEVRPGESS